LDAERRCVGRRCSKHSEPCSKGYYTPNIPKAVQISPNMPKAVQISPNMPKAVQIWMQSAAAWGDGVVTTPSPTQGMLCAKYARLS